MAGMSIAFSSEVATGSREENASKQEIDRFGSDLIRTRPLARQGDRRHCAFCSAHLMEIAV
jgi:hypothetical protein